MATRSHAYLKEESILEMSHGLQREQDCVRAAEIFLWQERKQGSSVPADPQKPRRKILLTVKTPCVS